MVGCRGCARRHGPELFGETLSDDRIRRIIAIRIRTAPLGTQPALTEPPLPILLLATLPSQTTTQTDAAVIKRSTIGNTIITTIAPANLLPAARTGTINVQTAAIVSRQLALSN